MRSTSSDSYSSFRFFPRRLTASAAAVVVLAASTWQEPRASEGRIFLRVTRLHGPVDIHLTLTADGMLVRHDGSQLVLGARGTTELDRDTTASFFTMARSLAPPIHRQDQPVEGDLYFVQLDDRLPIATIDAVADESLRTFVTALISEAERVPMEPNHSTFLSSEPVTPARASRLESRGATASQLENVADPIRSSVNQAVARPYELHLVPSSDFEFLEQRFGGREGYVIDASGTWHQISLWSPP